MYSKAQNRFVIWTIFQKKLKPTRILHTFTIVNTLCEIKLNKTQQLRFCAYSAFGLFDVDSTHFALKLACGALIESRSQH
jgi:hypothetical protein